MARLLLAAGAGLALTARAAQFQIYFDNACGGMNGTTQIGPAFSDICYTLPAGGQSVALTKCGSAVAGALYEVGVYSDDKCTGLVQTFNATYGACSLFNKEVLNQVLPPGTPPIPEPSVQVLDATCTTTAAGKSYYHLDVYSSTGCGGGDLSESVTIDGGNCAPNSLPSSITSMIPGYPQGQGLYSILATGGAGEKTLCFFESSSCGPCAVSGGGRISLQFSSVGDGATTSGSCTGFPTAAQTGIPIIIPLFGLKLNKAAPFPPVVAPTPSVTPLPSPSITPTPSGTPPPASVTPTPTLSPGSSPSVTPTGTPTPSPTPTPSRSAGAVEGKEKTPAADPATAQAVQGLVAIVAILCVALTVVGVFLVYRHKLKKEKGRRLARGTYGAGGAGGSSPGGGSRRDQVYRSAIGLAPDTEFGRLIGVPPGSPMAGAGGGAVTMASPLGMASSGPAGQSFRQGQQGRAAFAGVPTQGVGV